MKRLLKNRKGQGTTEYMVLLAIIVAIAVLFRQPISDAVSAKSKAIAGLIMDGSK
jgi:hypothetical protein